MSNLIPPLISNTPPPLENNIAASDDEEDFSDFHTGLGDYSYTCDGDPSAFTNTPELPELDINRNENENGGGISEDEDSTDEVHRKDFCDRRKEDQPPLPLAQCPIPADDISVQNILVPNATTNHPHDDSEETFCDNVVSRDDMQMVSELLKSNYIRDNERLNDVDHSLTNGHTDKVVNEKMYAFHESVKSDCTVLTEDVHLNHVDNTIVVEEDEISNEKSSSLDVFDSISEQTTESPDRDVADLKHDERSFDDNVEPCAENVEFTTPDGDDEETKDNIQSHTVDNFQSHPVDDFDDDDDGFGDFADFTSHEQHLEQPNAFFAPPGQPTITSTFEAFATFDSAATTSTETEPKRSPNFVEDDEFGDFSFQSAPPVVEPTLSEPTLPEMEDIFRNIFPLEPCEAVETASEFALETDSVFSLLRNLTETNALSYQWNKSNTQQVLLKVLNVDSRNVLFGAGWNSSMPIFASNLGLTPLEPMRSELTKPAASRAEPSLINEHEIDLKTDVVSSKSLEFDSAGGQMDSADVVANQKEISSLPSSSMYPSTADSESVHSLQFTDMTSESEPVSTQAGGASSSHSTIAVTEVDDFDVFSEFAENQHDQLPTITYNVPLRETHINTQEPPAALTRPEEDIKPHQSYTQQQRAPAGFEDEFSEFQASTPQLPLVVDSMQSTNRRIEYKLAIETHPVDPETIKRTHPVVPTSAAAVAPLQPVLLQPVKVAPAPTTPANAPSIAWPEPGITDDEIRKFEEYSFRKTGETSSASTITATPKSSVELRSRVAAKPAVADDDWSDFQGASLGTKCAELPLSIASLSAGLLGANTQQMMKKQSQQVNGGHQRMGSTGASGMGSFVGKQMSAASAGAHVEDEWSDFVSMRPSTTDTSRTTSSHHHDWARAGPQFTSWSTPPQQGRPGHGPYTSSASANSMSAPGGSSISFNGFNSFGPSAHVLSPSVLQKGIRPKVAPLRNNSSIGTPVGVTTTGYGHAHHHLSGSGHGRVHSISAPLPDMEFVSVKTAGNVSSSSSTSRFGNAARMKK